MTDSISRTSRFRLLLVLLVSLVGCDQASKQYAVSHWAHLENQPPQSYFLDTFRITFALNEGAFLGLFDKQSPVVRHVILVIGNGLLLAALAVAILLVSKIDRWSYLAWALVFAGGIGNLIDRIRINAVIDFLNLGIGPVRTGIFNVADMAITLGFVMLVPQIFRGEPKEAEAPAGSTATTPGTPS
jgi:signal peptidase II